MCTAHGTEQQQEAQTQQAFELHNEDGYDTEPIQDDDNSDDSEEPEALRRRRVMFYDEEGTPYTLEALLQQTQEQDLNLHFEPHELPHYEFSKWVDDTEIDRLIQEKLVAAFRFNQSSPPEE